MFCQSCGTLLPDGTKFCPNCGAKAITPDQAPFEPQTEAPLPELDTEPQPIYEAPVYAAPAYAAPAENLAAEEAASSALTWGILGLIFSLFLHVLGLIFSAIAISKASNCLKDYGVLPSQGKTGKGLGIAGLIVSILGIVLVIIIFLASIFAVAAAFQSGEIPVDFATIPIS